MDFAVPADHRVKLKESKKRDKYWGLAWETSDAIVTLITGIEQFLSLLMHTPEGSCVKTS